MNTASDPLSPFIRQLPLLGIQGQERLRTCTLLIAGLGGLGSVVAEQLVRLGVGTLYLVDNGTVNTPDLNRQILYGQSDIGKSKSLVAAERLNRLSLPTRLIPIHSTIDASFSLPDHLNGIVDCLDNFQARYVLNDLLVETGKDMFMVHGAVHGFMGQATTIVPKISRSLRSLFSDQQPSVDTIPVSAQIPGIIASVQVREVIGMTCGLGDTLVNRLLWIDLFEYRFEIIDLQAQFL